MLLLQAHFLDSDEVSYVKINLERVSFHDFNRIFWSRILDIHSINPEAMRKILYLPTKPMGFSMLFQLTNRKQHRGDNESWTH